MFIYFGSSTRLLKGITSGDMILKIIYGYFLNDLTMNGKHRNKTCLKSWQIKSLVRSGKRKPKSPCMIRCCSICYNRFYFNKLTNKIISGGISPEQRTGIRPSKIILVYVYSNKKYTVLLDGVLLSNKTTYGRRNVDDLERTSK